MIKELIDRVFALRDVAHLAHWSTKSYSEHMALGDFYDGLVDKIDAIVEAYQGQFGIIRGIKLECTMKGDIIDLIGQEAAWIAKNRTKLGENNDMLINMIDDLSALYSTTFYKLKNLH